jgi:hypothetical protein
MLQPIDQIGAPLNHPFEQYFSYLCPVNSCAQAVVRLALQLCFIVLQVVQPDKFTLSLRLRTPLSQGWLHLSWHPTAARVAMGQPPMRGDVSEAFSFAAQVGWSGC